MVQDINSFYRDGRIIGRANYNFTPEIATILGSIHGTLLNPNETIVMGRDFGNDSRMLKRAYTSGVMSTGINLLNLSDCTFPLLQFTVRRFGASGGFYFSGGHLYSEDVSVRFIDAGGIELSPEDALKIISGYDKYSKQVRRISPDRIGTITSIPQTQDVYIKSLEQFVDKKRIQKAGLKVVADSSYGPSGKISPILLNEIGVETIALNTHYRQKNSIPIPSINTIKNTADIIKASNSHLGVCFDVDGSRLLVLDENGLEVIFEDLLMLFIAYDDRIQKSKGNTIVLTPNVSPVVKEFIEEQGYPIKQVENHPGEISRQLREERACFGAADTLKFYFPQYAPFSDGNFILLKILEIMTHQDDLLSALVRGFPKGIKINKTIPISSDSVEPIHNRLRELVEENNLKYHDIINELRILEDDCYADVKVALNRDAILLTAESANRNKAKKMADKLTKLLEDL